ncbi:MAG: hypothetical protein JW839_19150 [Candidatus Lokiarchaeota archaeon]|nr:hypothetical protein [Candidatus Lokiarchaeota archaeon]
MPSIAHLFLGGMVGYSLYLISDKRFSKYHVMILFLSNYLGPDLGWVLGIGDFTHTYAGYIVFAFFLALFYSYFTRFSPDFKRRTLVDSGCNRVPYAAAFFLACAGGIMHIYLDGVMNHRGNFHLFPEIGTFEETIVSINDFFNFWYEPLVPASAAVSLIAGMGLVLAFIPFFWYMLKNLDRWFALKVGAFVGAFMALYYLVGSLTTLHADGGAVLYVALFWAIPFGLCALAMKWPPPRSPVERRARLKQQLVPALLVLGLVLGAAFLAAGIASLALADALVALAAGAWAPLAAHAGSLHALAVFLGIAFASFGSLCLLATAYNKLKKDVNVNVLASEAVTFGGSFACIVLTGIAFTSGGALVDIVVAEWPEALSIATPAMLLAVVVVLGVVFGALAGFTLAVGIGLLLERKTAFRIAFLFNAAFAWTIIGLYVCCLLSQDEVKKVATLAR